MTSLLLRRLIRHKFSSIVNLIGLTVGFSSYLAIQWYVNYAESFDKHIPGYETIYRVHSRRVQGGQEQSWKSSSSVILSRLLKEQIPGVIAAGRIHKFDEERVQLEIGTEKTRRGFTTFTGFHADPEIIDIFSIPVLSGNASTCLMEPFSVILTKSLALQLFGEGHGIGEPITITDRWRYDVKVTAIVEDPPPNSHFQFDYLVSLSTFRAQRPHWAWHSMYWDYFHTYTRLEPGIETEDLQKTLIETTTQFARSEYEARDYFHEFDLMNIGDIHLFSKLGNELGSAGHGQLLPYLSGMSYLVLLIALINYLNLKVAQSMAERRAAAVRKVLGALLLPWRFL